MGRSATAACNLSSSPTTVSSLVSFPNPSSPARPFSKASIVARLTPALRDNATWLSLSALRRSASWVPIAMRSSTLPSILGRSDVCKGID